MRRFEFREGGSSKFWAVVVAGRAVKTQWGRIGTDGQTQSKTYGSAAAAKAAAAKQIAEKVGKGYAEVKAGKAARPRPAKAANAATPAKQGRGTFAFTAEYDELFARGYPHLRRLAPDVKKNVAAAVKKQLAAGDPEIPVDVPADVARAFLSAMAHDRRDAAARAAAIAKPADVDRTLLDVVLTRLCPSLVSEIYAFRIHDAIFLFEAFLGTEPVAEAIVRRFVDISRQPSLWSQKDNGNDHAFHVADALGFMRLRMPPARWTAITKPLRSVKKSSLLFTERIALLVDDRRKVVTRNETLLMYTLAIALQRGDKATLRAKFAKHASWSTPRFTYLMGVEHLDTTDLKSLLTIPAWKQRRVVAEYGHIQGPQIERVMQTLATGRAAAKEANAWLAHHAVSAPAANGKSHKPLTYAQANKIIDKAFSTLEKQLVGANGNAKQELAIMKDAYQLYCESRAAAGDIMPEAYFTHRIGDINWKADRPQIVQWLNVAMKAAA